jgi:ferric-dicitrate binding protein FerR (iron transport regulator)
MKTLYYYLAVILAVLTSCADNNIVTKDNFEMVELPDGSIAFLSHNSSVAFDEDFDTREVTADGELFFSVVEGQSPFTVKTKEGDITVLGTEFSVSTVDDKVEVEVEEGVVELSSNDVTERVERGGAAVFDDGEKTIRKMKAEFKFRKWMRLLKAEFKEAGREMKKASKEFGRESKKLGKKLKKELKD